MVYSEKAKALRQRKTLRKDGRPGIKKDKFICSFDSQRALLY